jgi:hypothetical protein
MNDEPVSVSAEIENGPVATKSTVDPNSALTSAGLTQAARATRAYQGLCLGVPIPELTQSSKRDDLHSNQDMSFP